MDYKLDLTRFSGSELEGVPSSLRHAWPLVIDCASVNMSPDIFVFHAGKAGDFIEGDKFECIASVSQLYELPINKPMDGVPYYRLSRLEMVCRSAAEANRVWKEIQDEAQVLVANFNSARRLQGVEKVSVSETIIVSESLEMKPPIEYQLAYQPAGTATDTDGVQGITDSDDTLQGWLPASEAPDSWIRPSGAFLYYNIEKDTGLQALWPPAEPFSGNMLYRNGVRLPHGVMFAITKDTIWWLRYIPETLPQYTRLGSIQDGNAPWGLDYVSPSNPGVVSPQLRLVLFK